ncbi:DedA family protein [Actinomadura rupiterrae]|uniref:DedA family protein n=1 Tax=Actinomadura rupiterrae TaxID=559627 RepID=UPI0020A24CC8|nr:DedA family protein [Actinomadura rupiterrae]MCP2339463.1 membrane protein DedA with SNARE-associated domain [Actinomadura rupiterrae]
MRDSFWGMPLWLGVLVAVLIIFVRGQVYYWIGRGVGPRVYTSRVGRRIGEERLRRVEATVARRGLLAVVAAHWIAGVRHAIPIMAGVSRMPLPRFTLASAIGAALWTPPWVVGGYAVVWGWLKVFRESPLLAAGLTVLLAAVVASLVVWRRRARTSRAKNATQNAAQNAAEAAPDEAGTASAGVAVDQEGSSSPSAG